MATRTPKRLTRSSVNQRASTPKKHYLRDVTWAKGVLVAAGNEDYEDLSLVDLIKAALKDGIDLTAMRPDSLSETEKGNRSRRQKRRQNRKRSDTRKINNTDEHILVHDKKNE